MQSRHLNKQADQLSEKLIDQALVVGGSVMPVLKAKLTPAQQRALARNLECCIAGSPGQDWACFDEVRAVAAECGVGVGFDRMLALARQADRVRK